MMTGTVKRIVAEKGFGFIRTSSGTEYFFHRSACQPEATYDALREGSAVTFELGEGPKGPRADRVEAA